MPAEGTRSEGRRGEEWGEVGGVKVGLRGKEWAGKGGVMEESELSRAELSKLKMTE
jgi:hypothetical protein